ncbi:MAG TPA: hypothetical protein VMT17_15530 [Anaeromyxobacteraceae bacterium]|nr:hypothetical protein [Anaeromyxobacteraceae bacterium]
MTSGGSRAWLRELREPHSLGAILALAALLRPVWALLAILGAAHSKRSQVEGLIFLRADAGVGGLVWETSEGEA